MIWDQEKVDRARNNLVAACELVPAHMRPSLHRHVELGHAVGGFLTALLEGNIARALVSADPNNERAWPQWIEALQLIPDDCHGSADRVNKWRQHRGLSGLGFGADERKQ